MQTTLYGNETPQDLQCIQLLEDWFNLPVAFFHPIRQAYGETHGYWHCRMKGSHEAIFIRLHELGRFVMYQATQKHDIGGFPS